MIYTSKVHIVKPDHDPKDILDELIALVEELLNGDATIETTIENDYTENGDGLIIIASKGTITTDNDKFGLRTHQRIRMKRGHVIISTTEIKVE